MSVGLYFHTLRHLRPAQFYGRVARRLRSAAPDLRPAPARRALAAPFPVARELPARMLAPLRFRFLNVTHELAAAEDWSVPGADRLWRYNLHYFDDLMARDAADRADAHRALIRGWIAGNPPAQGEGWEPYPLSLRLVNWIKWSAMGHALPQEAEQSLAVQARFLAARLEYHLLGNHLWANGKALVFAAVHFEGPEAAEWLRTGLHIVESERREQVLADGGHFERSPMYHSIVLADLLDLIALAGSAPGTIADSVVAGWRETAAAMLRWLRAMTHPDGRIAFFNDAAFDIAPEPEVLARWAQTLGVAGSVNDAQALTLLQPSGYARLTRGDFVLIADVGPVGPDYIPGHAHADTLSFELSWRGRRVLTNSGTSNYGTGPRRQYERSTAAHNALVLDDQNSSEVWHGFRVARRAYPRDCNHAAGAEQLWLACSHDGYTRLPGQPVHRREWRLHARSLSVADTVSGAGRHHAQARLHLAPGIEVQRSDERTVRAAVPEAGELQIAAAPGLRLDLSHGEWAPEFGRALPRTVLGWQRNGEPPLHGEVRIAEAA